MNLHELWHMLTTSRYTRALESEVARLREENRALVNSLLGTAGVPPVPNQASGTNGGRDGAALMPPHRRRSWQQVGRMLEMAEARRIHRGAGNRTPSEWNCLPGMPRRTPGAPPTRASSPGGTSPHSAEGPTAPPSEFRSGR